MSKLTEGFESPPLRLPVCRPGLAHRFFCLSEAPSNPPTTTAVFLRGSSFRAGFLNYWDTVFYRGGHHETVIRWPGHLDLVGTGVRAQDHSVQELAEKLRKLDVRVFKPGSDAAKQATDLVWKYFKAQHNQVNLDSLKWKINTKAELGKVREEKITQLKTYLGKLPEPPTQVTVQVTKTIAGDGFVIENLLYESRPGLWVTANLYRPQPLPKSLPGILIIHSHHNPKTQGELQDMGMLRTAKGRLLCAHPRHARSWQAPATSVSHGERLSRPVQSRPPGLLLPLQLRLAVATHRRKSGRLDGGVQRGVDLLLKKPGIDPRRIALFGSVAGGGDPAAVTAALDPH